ncbi:hypothetical protein [Catenulispora rubra]|uniref:hypothetical protein n=1 Tax=Catenulispora rubra TaxID=280293 RepID=UPI0018922582|nr:hypothetical protein [Catenulispora rubra]
MTSYRIEALLRRFDTRADTATTGHISGFLGETILLEATGHWLTSIGHDVELLGGTPRRDDSAFGAWCPMPTVRDLDAWFLLDGSDLLVVECKCWTAASMDGATVPDDAAQRAQYAQDEWFTMLARHIDTDRWTGTNKVFLPLIPPGSLSADVAEAAMAKLRRVLAVWRPLSLDGTAFTATVTADSVLDDQLRPAVAEVFSASLYLRSLLERGETHLTTRFGMTERLLGAVAELLDPGFGVAVES